MDRFLDMVTGILKHLVSNYVEKPIETRGLLWTVLAYAYGLSVLALLLREPLLIIVVVLCNAIMPKLDPPKLKVQKHYKSKR